ncbi:hypothetical protein O6H91_Y269100 [Diphasiastrum complanatum]|nr:hypothetical protein O6H91_Y269100 [Diphasiastrum complanatum]
MVDAHLMELVSFSDVLWRRWLRCIIWHSVISSIMWLLWELLCPSFGSNHRWRLILLPTLITFIGYILFLTAQLLFIVGETLVLQPESKDSASVGELVVGISTLAWRAALGGTSQGDLAFRIADLVQKMEALRDRVLFIILCIASGCLSLLSLGSPMYSYLGSLGMLDMSLRGAILGLFYGLWYIYQKRYVITFPIIQVNPDLIDVAKVPELPPRDQSEEDVYAFLHEEAMQSAGPITRAECRRRVAAHSPDDEDESESESEASSGSEFSEEEYEDEESEEGGG